ncbi:helix-turn-helix transcriptional regulator [Demequina sp. NBRC 110054]|uniref:helix-turn-helix transcriptional regulator n=1 Tax=Demequina sp. NBRC 110054 TaxID=1570343 RepID=UPI000A057EAA|nr:helix-turn-helix transcriptional regulator [Demequina sp. NBRC 110054]
MPPRRTRPRDLGSDWPDRVVDDPAGEVARRIAVALRTATAGLSLRQVAEATGVNYTTVRDVLLGNTFGDSITISRLEIGLGVALWPADFTAAAARRRGVADDAEAP